MEVCHARLSYAYGNRSEWHLVLLSIILRGVQSVKLYKDFKRSLS